MIPNEQEVISLENELINSEKYFAELEKAFELSDETEKETRLALLRQFREAELNWTIHMRKYEYKTFCEDIKRRGIRFTPVNNSATKAKWTNLFAASISKEDRKKVYFDQYKWHLFSYELLDALTEDDARAAFNAQPKDQDTVYLFWQNARKAFLVENAHLLKAEELDHDYIPFQDFYLFSPDGKWTYIRTHESMCGPYFYKLP